MNINHKVEIHRTTRGVCWFGIDCFNGVLNVGTMKTVKMGKFLQKIETLSYFLLVGVYNWKCQ